MDYDYSVQSDNFSHVDRQWHYYTRALHYLGLIDNSKRGIILKTKLGEEIFENKDNRLKEIAKVVFSHTFFNKCFREDEWEEPRKIFR